MCLQTSTDVRDPDLTGTRQFKRVHVCTAWDNRRSRVSMTCYDAKVHIYKINTDVRSYYRLPRSPNRTAYVFFVLGSYAKDEVTLPASRLGRNQIAVRIIRSIKYKPNFRQTSNGLRRNFGNYFAIDSEELLVSVRDHSNYVRKLKKTTCSLCTRISKSNCDEQIRYRPNPVKTGVDTKGFLLEIFVFHVRKTTEMINICIKKTILIDFLK